MYSAFLLYVFWLDCDGNLQANCVFRILSVKMWGKKQRKWQLVEVQRTKEYEELKEHFQVKETGGNSKNGFIAHLQGALSKKFPSAGNPLCHVPLAKLCYNYP